MSSVIQVVPIPFDRSSVTRFITFAWEIYRDDPHWVPPLIHDQRKLLNPQKNPFFKNSEAQLLGAFENGKMVGRLAVGINQSSNQFRHENVAFFGFFESLNRPEIAQALFQKAEEWAKSKGKEILRGPFNLTFHDDCGLLVEGFHLDPYLLMTYNPPYYESLIESTGLKRVMDAYAFYGKVNDIVTSKLLEISDKVEQQLKPVIRTMDPKKDFLKNVHIAMDMVNGSLEGHWATYPLSKTEIEYKANDLKQIIIPDLCFFVEVQGRPVGFSLSLPNYNEAIKKANGRLFPFGLFKILYHARKIKSLMSFQLGMIKEFQDTGLGAYCYAQIWKRAKKLGYYDGEGGRVFANNPRMLKAAELLGTQRYKTYRWYEKQIA